MTAYLPVFEDTLGDFWPVENGEFVRSLGVDLDGWIAPSSEAHATVIEGDVVESTSTELVTLDRRIDPASWLIMGAFTSAIAFVLFALIVSA